MKKSVVISIVALVFLLVIGMSFWKWKNAKNAQISQNNQNKQNEKESQDKDDLTWYTVPELGIEFKTTLDTKEDLGYFEEKNQKGNIATIYFYSKSEKDFIDKNSTIERNSALDYSSMAISRISEKEKAREEMTTGRSWCITGKIVATFDGYFYCKNSGQSSVFDSPVQYENYKKLVKEKKFDIFLDSMRNIQ